MERCRTLIIMFFLALPTLAMAAEDFPGRSQYRDVTIIELNELGAKFDQVNVIDVRSEYEYNTLHIKGARHVPLDDLYFTDRLKKLIEKTGKPVVFYCNGHHCMKSYIAARKAHKAGIQRSSAFDAGIFDWVSAYPERAVLLGQSPVSPEKLLSKAEFEKHLLSPSRFNAMAKTSIVIDVRSRLQRAAAGLFPFEEQWVTLDNHALLDSYIAKAKKTGKPLLVYDGVGTQVRWLQYYLKAKGVKRYYFMRGGAEGYYAHLDASQAKPSLSAGNNATANKKARPVKVKYTPK